MHHQAALTAALAAERGGKPYKKYTKKERYEIGRYASENSTAAGCRKFKSKFNIGESTVRSFQSKYEQIIKSTKRKSDAPESVIKEKKRGRPILLSEIMELNSMVRQTIWSKDSYYSSERKVE